MIYGLIADLLVVVHLLFILFALFGGLLVLKNKWWLFAHLPAALWAFLIEVNGWICPLTHLENYYRILAAKAEYQVGFIEYYLMPIIYPRGLTPEIQVVLGFIVIILNLLIYIAVIRKCKHET